ncbi:MAG: MarR family transcriptional regulator, partial [Thermoflexales bacterium]|nr:MarR family transcriptional regulator [Thermoflexales bacterium]
TRWRELTELALDSAQRDEQDSLELRITEYLRECGGTASVSELLRRFHVKAARLHSVLAELVDRGLVEVREYAPQDGVGRRARVVVLLGGEHEDEASWDALVDDAIA